ncbi:NAD-dependent protein deacylase [Paenibacillus sp. UNC451MF]|uniref:NAD-dependent protein deacylase n=1 Tax=Paenibacillus sp. UNC451MF TaxID=1449063 RepID=UPI00048DC9B4|nr:NAD-dependent protein deacylase [Paenibacillus sp. UNC451MF]
MDLQQLKCSVAESGNIVFFGGAGVSTESSIPDFCSASGLYQTKSRFSVPPETILSRSFFMQHTADFYEFYISRMIYKDAVPNAAHKALARLEQVGKLKAVVTQNIDGLHQAAGSQKVLELHGSVHRNYCMDCGTFFDLQHMVSCGGSVPKCNQCGGTVKPDVVLYEEPLDYAVMEQAAEYISKADVLIVGGTSLTVNPAAGLIRYYGGNNLILINQSATTYDSRADYLVHASIGKVLTELVEGI